MHMEVFTEQWSIKSSSHYAIRKENVRMEKKPLAANDIAQLVTEHGEKLVIIVKRYAVGFPFFYKYMIGNAQSITIGKGEEMISHMTFLKSIKASCKNCKDSTKGIVLRITVLTERMLMQKESMIQRTFPLVRISTFIGLHIVAFGNMLAIDPDGESIGKAKCIKNTR